jgi:hypothetical protein
MSEQYSHRNGETEPPKTWGRYYWFRGKITYARHRQSERNDFDWYGIVWISAGHVMLHNTSRRIYLGGCVGQWWGPIELPEVIP